MLVINAPSRYPSISRFGFGSGIIKVDAATSVGFNAALVGQSKPGRSGAESSRRSTRPVRGTQTPPADSSLTAGRLRARVRGRSPVNASLLAEGVNGGIDCREEVTGVERPDQLVALELGADGILELGEYEERSSGV
jgi:hypothetical protein